MLARCYVPSLKRNCGYFNVEKWQRRLLSFKKRYLHCFTDGLGKLRTESSKVRKKKRKKKWRGWSIFVNMQLIDTKLTWELKLVVSIKSDCVVPENIRTPPPPFDTIKYNTIQYKFYCQLPIGSFQRQILIVQVIKKQTNKHILKNCQ